MKWLWFVVILGIASLITVAWVMNEMDTQMNQTVVKTGTILNWYPEKEGLVLTIAVNDSLYKINTNATMINVKEPVILVFKGNSPVTIIQGDRAFGIRDWQKLKTIEKMPEVEKNGQT